MDGVITLVKCISKGNIQRNAFLSRAHKGLLSGIQEKYKKVEPKGNITEIAYQTVRACIIFTATLALVLYTAAPIYLLITITTIWTHTTTITSITTPNTFPLFMTISNTVPITINITITVAPAVLVGHTATTTALHIL